MVSHKKILHKLLKTVKCESMRRIIAGWISKFLPKGSVGPSCFVNVLPVIFLISLLISKMCADSVPLCGPSCPSPRWSRPLSASTLSKPILGKPRYLVQFVPRASAFASRSMCSFEAWDGCKQLGMTSQLLKRHCKRGPRSISSRKQLFCSRWRDRSLN